MLAGAYDELAASCKLGDALYRHAHHFRIIHYSRRHYNDNDRNNDRVEIGRDARDAGIDTWGESIRTRRRVAPTDSSENC